MYGTALYATLEESATNFSHIVLAVPGKGHREINNKHPYFPLKSIK